MCICTHSRTAGKKTVIGGWGGGENLAACRLLEKSLYMCVCVLNEWNNDNPVLNIFFIGNILTQDEDLLYSSHGYTGPRRFVDDSDELAGEFKVSKTTATEKREISPK